MTTRTSLAPPDAPAGSGATFRRWRDLDDIEGMAASNARLRAHIGLLEPIDVDAMRHHYTHLVHSDPAVDCILAERDGETRGYARVERRDLTDGGSLRGLLGAACAHPGHRRQGLARAAIARSLALLRAEGAGSACLGVDADNHNRALALYESCGFRRASTSANYRKPMPATKD